MSKPAVNATAAESMSVRDILGPLIAIIVGLFMVILDGTAMNVAIPTLQEDFGQGLNVVQWTVTGYALAQAAVIPLAGWLSDRFGAKRVFLISVALFTIGSLLCGLATSVEQLIVFRVLQGIGGGMVGPIAMAFTYRLAPPGKVGAVMGMMGIPILLAPALGPIVGGWLVEYATWHWIFFINLPIGVIGVLVGLRTLPNIERQSVAALDRLGIILGPIAFAGLAYGVSEGAFGWTSEKTIIGISVGIVALILFIIVELKHKNPLLELRVFKSPDFTRGIVIQWISTVALFGTMFMVPLFLQQGKGYEAFRTGLIMLPQALAAGLFMPIGGRLYDKIGARPVVVSGMISVAVAAFLLSRVSLTDDVSSILLPLSLLGAGMGLSMMPLNTHLMQSAPQNLVGRVTSLTNAAQQVWSSLAIAGLITILSSRMKSYMSEGATDMAAVGTKAFNDTFFILVGIASVGVLVALFLKKPKNASQPAAEPAPMAMH